jgi:hypothetical protein
MDVCEVNTIEYLIKKYDVDIKKESPFILNFNRMKDLPLLFKELGFHEGAEIGVLEGEFTEALAKPNPDIKIYAVDAWRFYPLRNNFRKPYHYIIIEDRARKRLLQYPNVIIIREWSMDAVKRFGDESLDFVYIDADHRFEYVTNDIAEWSKKVRTGGIISGHDYTQSRNRKATYCHVKNVVDAWTYAHGIHPWFVFSQKPQGGWMFVK